MKKTFGIMGTGLLLASNVLMSFSNVSFACSRIEYCNNIEIRGCYVFAHNYSYSQPVACSAEEYSEYGYNNDFYGGTCGGNNDAKYESTVLIAYKCDEKGGVLDLRNAPLENGQHISSIGEDAFSGTNVTKVIMPSTVEYIGDGAFCNVKRLGDPKCGNGIIEQGEDCDDGDKIFMLGMNDNYICNNECKRVLAPVCGNEKLEQGENCFNCPGDVMKNGGNCTESVGEEIDVKFLDENQDLENKELEKQDLDQEDLEYKGEYRQISRDGGSSEDLVEVADFVVIDFPDGMNEELDIEDLDYACAKLQEYTITFITEDGDELGTGETLNQHMLPFIVPEVPEEDGFIGTWYLGNEIFDFNSQITDDITLVYKYEKGGIEYDEENGWVKVSLGDQEIIIKDKNQEAEKSVNEIDTGNSSDFINAVGTYYLWGNNTGLDSSEIFDDNGQILDEVILPGGFDHGYLGMEGGDDWTMGSNDTPCNADSGEYLPSPEEWKILMQLWGKLNEYELVYYNGMYSFRDSSVLYPDPGHGGKSLNVFINAGPGMGGSESYDQVPGNVQYSSAIKKFLNDLYISEYPSLYVENWGVDFGPASILFPSSLNNGRVGYLTMNGLFVFEESNLEGVENNIATPVRCFVKPQFEVSFEVNGGTDVVTQKIFSGDKAIEPEVQKENAEFLGWFTEDGTKFVFDTPIKSDIKLHAEWQEKKTNNGYSGGGGGGSSSSNASKSSDKLDNSAKEKIELTSEKDVRLASDEKMDTNQQNNFADNDQKQDEDKSTVVPQKVTYVPDTTLSEDEQAYNFAYAYGITNKTSVESAQMNSPLTRIQMAKILSQYAINVLGKTPDTSKNVRFKDVTDKKDLDYDNGVTLSYQLGIMGQNMKNGKFRPDDEVTRAEFVTALSRLLYSTSDGKYKSTSKYYTYHMEKLKEEGIITKDNPKMKEKRGYVMIMLMRSAK